MFSILLFGIGTYLSDSKMRFHSRLGYQNSNYNNGSVEHHSSDDENRCTKADNLGYGFKRKLEKSIKHVAAFPQPFPRFEFQLDAA